MDSVLSRHIILSPLRACKLHIYFAIKRHVACVLFCLLRHLGTSQDVGKSKKDLIIIDRFGLYIIISRFSIH